MTSSKVVENEKWSWPRNPIYYTTDSVLTASLWESINVDWREDLIWVDDASNTQHTQMVSMSKLSDNYSDKIIWYALITVAS